MPRLLPLLALLLMPLLAACSPGRTVEAVALLRDLATPPAAGAALAGVERQEVVLPGGRPADLYRPPAPRAAVVVVPGAAEAGRRDARLVAFAGDLARADFLVMVPQLAAAAPLQVSAADADAVAEAVTWLAETAAPRVGLVGISYAAGPAVLAALRPEVADHVAFIAAIGGYHDITAAITYMITGAYRAGPQEPWRSGPADPRAKWRFLAANAERAAPEDAGLLHAIAARRLADPTAAVDDLTPALGAEGRSVWALLSAPDPAQVPALIAGLPPPLRADIAALDLSARDLTPLTAEVLLIHGRDDPLVPHTESLALAHRLGPAQAQVTVVDGLFHVELRDLDAAAMLALVRAAYRLLAYRDSAPAPAPQPSGPVAPAPAS